MFVTLSPLTNNTEAIWHDVFVKKAVQAFTT